MSPPNPTEDALIRRVDGPIQQGSLSKLIRYLIQLSQEGAYANIRLVVQRGRIEWVHVDRTYRVDGLPVRGEGASGERTNPPL